MVFFSAPSSGENHKKIVLVYPPYKLTALKHTQINFVYSVWFQRHIQCTDYLAKRNTAALTLPNTASEELNNHLFKPRWSHACLSGKSCWAWENTVTRDVCLDPILRWEVPFHHLPRMILLIFHYWTRNINPFWVAVEVSMPYSHKIIARNSIQ